MFPIAATASAPNPISQGDLPREPIKFDGIALFLVTSLKQFTDAFSDPYYIEIIEPDEREMLNKDGPGSGITASFQGKMIDMVHYGRTSLNDGGKQYGHIFEESVRRQHSGETEHALGPQSTSTVIAARRDDLSYKPIFTNQTSIRKSRGDIYEISSNNLACPGGVSGQRAMEKVLNGWNPL